MQRHESLFRQVLTIKVLISNRIESMSEYNHAMSNFAAKHNQNTQTTGVL